MGVRGIKGYVGFRVSHNERYLLERPSNKVFASWGRCWVVGVGRVKGLVSSKKRVMGLSKNTGTPNTSYNNLGYLLTYLLRPPDPASRMHLYPHESRAQWPLHRIP